MASAPAPFLGAVAGLAAVAGLTYAAQHAWGWWPAIVAIAATLLVVAVGLALPRAASSAGVAAHVVSAVLAVAAVLVPVTLALLHRDGLSDWIPVYVAGAIGGLVLELIDARWQVEVPGPAGEPLDPTKDNRRPLLAEVDFGVCGRALTGGLAAFVVVLLGAAATADDVNTAVTEASRSVLSLGVAVAVGAASVAAWDAIRRAAASRWEVIEGAKAALTIADEAHTAEVEAEAGAEVATGHARTTTRTRTFWAGHGGRRVGTTSVVSRGAHDDAALEAASRAGEVLGAIRAARAMLDTATARRGRRGH